MGVVGSLLGGLGIFLLGIMMLTDGLLLAAGSSLRNILAYWTNTAFRSILSGFFMTAFVHSSSAVMIASIGFVNAGMLTLRQSITILYGAKIGTSTTAWLVAIVGFNFNIQAFALPMIGIGMMIRLFNKSDDGKMPAIGMALVGFGLFFVGIDILKTAFEGFVALFEVSSISVDGIKGLFVFLLIGMVMTILTQSSGAAIALTITAAASGMVSVYSAAAMVIGANVGTSSTALLTTIGATANAKRVAWAQIIFNFGTGIIALFVLPVLFFLFKWLTTTFNFTLPIGIQLALFDTTFNVIGVLFFFPLNNKLADYLETKFIAREEQPMLPKYLDSSISVSPALAINALVLELKENAKKVRNLPQIDFNNTASVKDMKKELAIIRSLSKQVSDFIVTVEQHALSEETTKQLALLLRIDEYLLTCARAINNIYHQYHNLNNEDIATLKPEFNLYNSSFLTTTDFPQDTNYDALHAQVKKEHDRIKNQLLIAGSRGEISFYAMAEVLDILREQMRMIQQWLKAINSLQLVNLQTQKPD